MEGYNILKLTWQPQKLIPENISHLILSVPADGTGGAIGSFFTASNSMKPSWAKQSFLKDLQL